MIFLGILASIAAIGFLCWLLFTLAVFALPLFAGVSIGTWAYGTGAGWPGAILIGLVGAALTLGIGQFLLIVVRPLWIRLLVAAAFVLPAAIAGYHAVLSLSQIGVPSLLWREVFAWTGAIFIGGTAWTRMTVFAEPLPLRPGGASQNEPQPLLTAATREG